MIKFAPVRSTPSASLKDEQLFDSLPDLILFITDRRRRLARYIGSSASCGSIVLEDLHLDDPRIGWKSVRKICVGSVCVGYCGE